MRICTMYTTWKKLLEAARKEYHPVTVSPFINSHHVACALESEDGTIYTGFCIESCCGVLDLCAERVAALNMYQHSGQTKVKKILVARENPPRGKSSELPCGACREFFLQLDEANKDMEIMFDYEKEEIIKLKDLIPLWWGEERYKK